MTTTTRKRRASRTKADAQAAAGLATKKATEAKAATIKRMADETEAKAKAAEATEAKATETPEAEDEAPATKSAVPLAYRQRYKAKGHADRCGDQLSDVLKAELTVGNGKSRTLDLARLTEIASSHGLAEKLAGYSHLNPGMRRMNIGNVLRAMVKRGETVRIGETVWNAEAAEAG